MRPYDNINDLQGLQDQEKPIEIKVPNVDLRT